MTYYSYIPIPTISQVMHCLGSMIFFFFFLHFMAIHPIVAWTKLINQPTDKHFDPKSSDANDTKKHVVLQTSLLYLGSFL